MPKNFTFHRHSEKNIQETDKDEALGMKLSILVGAVEFSPSHLAEI